MRFTIAIACILFTASLHAEEFPSIRALRIDTPPLIDGKLDEAVWAQAEAGGPLTEYEPEQGPHMTERSEFKVLYDAETLYVGIWMYDTRPEDIIARKMTRDGSIFSDDYTYFAIDTFHDQRNGYVFSINPNGARYDGTVSNNGKVNANWDGAWRGKTTIDDEGWKVEIAIPLYILSFDPDNTAWGFNISRTIKRKNEQGRWSSPLPQLKTHMMAGAGDLTGLTDLEQGIGLQLSPYVAGRYVENEAGGRDRLLDFGGDVRYRLTPNLALSLSYNMDFAETEVDARQINFSRFPLFFPEKRDFFLEDGGIFNSVTHVGLVPFHSRRIGLNDGGIVPIDLAGKLAGQVGDYNVGLIHANLDAAEGNEQVFVSRLSKNLLDQSSVGWLTTVGDPITHTDNVVFGPDLRYRNNKIFGNQIFQASASALGAYAEGTNSNASETVAAYGLNVALPNDRYHFDAGYLHIGEDFNPGLGYVRRTGIHRYNSNFSFQPRPAGLEQVRKLRFSYVNDFTTSLGNEMESQNHSLYPVFIDFQSGDQFWFRVQRQFDAPETAFKIADDITVDEGNYWGTDYQVKMLFTQRRMFSGTFNFGWGEYYNGNRQTFDVETDFVPSKHLFTALDYTYNHFDLVGGEADVHVGEFRMRFNFTPDLSWSHQLQWDSISESFGYNSRVQWEFQPGSTAFFVLNQDIAEEDDTLRLQRSEGVVKVGANIWF
jgi:hypothetical protein